ncbi:MAG: DUF429 domain-containing protein [Anaerolineales bacterium]|nr:DUF429 domain-containing protein [Anaerolineales bacterium]
MLFSHTTFIGIDPTAGRKPFTYAALDQARGMAAMAQGNLEAALAFAAGQSRAVIAVSAPAAPHQGLLEKEAVRRSLSPPPRPGRWTKFRVAEYLLRQRNIKVPKTPGRVQDCPRWMQMGFTLYSRLRQVGYQPYPSEDAPLQYLEVYPHASFAVLIGHTPLPKHSLEGRLQRQLCLFEQGLNVPDPMRFFEEITRHRLINGVLPFEELFTPQELDALVSAYTAWLAIQHPDQACLLGDPDEGQVVLPAGELKARY